MTIQRRLGEKVALAEPWDRGGAEGSGSDDSCSSLWLAALWSNALISMKK